MGANASLCCQKAHVCCIDDTLAPAASSLGVALQVDVPIPSDDGDGASLGGLLGLVNDKASSQRNRTSAKPSAKRGRIGGGRIADDDPGSDYLNAHKVRREKGLDTRTLIKEAMKLDRVCALLQESEMETIVDTMEFFEFKKDDFIVEQGQIGDTFFVAHEGTLEVTVGSRVFNTMRRGNAFGGLALLYNCPRTASVKAQGQASCWGANGRTFQKVLQENAKTMATENRKFIDAIKTFDGMTDRQKDRIGESFRVEVVEDRSRVFTEGEEANALYIVKKGQLRRLMGGTVNAEGLLVGGTDEGRIGPGECVGERAMLDNKPHDSTCVTSGRCTLLCISVADLVDVLGEDVARVLERNFLLQCMRKSTISQFSSNQQYAVLNGIVVKLYKKDETIEDGLRLAVVVDGSIQGLSKDRPATLGRGQWYEDAANVEQGESKSKADMTGMTGMKAGAKGARIGVLTKDSLLNALKESGGGADGGAEQAADFERKMVLAKKVHIFRHLSQEQTTKLVAAFALMQYKKGNKVIMQGEGGTSFYVVASGEVNVFIGDKHVRTMGKNAYFGERALLFDEPRTATIEVSSSEAELWSIEKTTFSQIVKGKMQQELMHRIRLQDTSVTMKDLRTHKVIGQGAAGVVRLVQHKKTQTRYALKRVAKVEGKIPEEVRRECSLLAENDHPFIMALVKTFETDKSVYMLTELITGGELHSAIRHIPGVLTKPQAQFYVGSLVIVLEALADRSILYRDLKPENVMLDQQGYLKVIDFGIAKKLDEGNSHTFTMIGTPHYMAPEVMKGRGYGTEVDLWSLGVMLFEFVCGYLPFANDLDDPSEVCAAVLKHELTFPKICADRDCQKFIQGLLTRQPKKRLGSGIHGFEDVKNVKFFKINSGSLFNKIMGRELDPPVTPKGETYCGPDEDMGALSDDGELG